MRIMRITDEGGNVSCAVIAPAPKLAVELESVKEYFADQLEQNKEDFGEALPLRVELVPYEEEFNIVFDGGPIKHTAREWAAIYEGCGPMMISSSEY